MVNFAANFGQAQHREHFAAIHLYVTRSASTLFGRNSRSVALTSRLQALRPTGQRLPTLSRIDGLTLRQAAAASRCDLASAAEVGVGRSGVVSARASNSSKALSTSAKYASAFFLESIETCAATSVSTKTSMGDGTVAPHGGGRSNSTDTGNDFPPGTVYSTLETRAKHAEAGVFKRQAFASLAIQVRHSDTPSAENGETGNALQSNSHGGTGLAPDLCGYAGSTSERSARTPFKNDERSSPPSTPSARPGAGLNEPIVSAGADPFDSVAPRNGDRVGEAVGPLGLTPSRLPNLNDEPRRDRAPEVRLQRPARFPVRVFPDVDPIALREHCGRDCRLNQCGHPQPLSRCNICAVALRVSRTIPPQIRSAS